MDIYVYQQPKHCPYPFAEIEDGVPVHPLQWQERVSKLVASRKPWATLNYDLLCLVGWMIANYQLSLPVHIIHVNLQGVERTVRFDVKGEFIEPWPESGLDSIMDAGFHYRYSRPVTR